MSSQPRKRLGAEEKEISPPLLRRKLNHDYDTKPASEPPLRSRSAPKEAREGKEGRARFEILSWNINGISHLLPQTQPSIKSFFRKSSGSGTRQTPETEDEDETRQYATAEAPLRKFLRRHGFPQIVCLQEVKISPKDKMARKAVERAANGGDAPGYKASSTWITKLGVHSRASPH
jgi:hypothetical protein